MRQLFVTKFFCKNPGEEETWHDVSNEYLHQNLKKHK